jgi:hypothetical protein
VARASGRPFAPEILLCSEAWPHFERGDREGYAREIARCIQASPASAVADVIVLAQASMAGAAALLANVKAVKAVKAPILSSPRLGLEVALERWHAAGGGGTP